MVDDTLIADLIRAGVSPELVGRVANAIALSGTMSGTSAEAVREYHRLQKQAQRANQRNLQGKPEANDAGSTSANAAYVSRTVPDNRCSTFFLSSTDSQQTEKKREVIARARGTRIEPDWQPTPDDRQFAIGRGFSDSAIANLRDEFVDYWVGVPGQRGAKLDWSATWRNRVRTQKPQHITGKANGNHRGRSLAAAADDLIARAESFERENDLGPIIDAEPCVEGGQATRR